MTARSLGPSSTGHPAVDAVVIGSGPNGLVAANLLADAGWSVRVLEAAPVPGGAVRSAALTVPGFRHDLFSSFYPLAMLSPAIRSLGLERHGLRWCRAPFALTHVGHRTCTAVVHDDPEETAAELDRAAPGDGAAWMSMVASWQRHRDWVIAAMFTPFPPVRTGAAVAARHVRSLGEFARFAVLPVRRLAEESFAGEAARLLLFGNALHADISPEGAGSGLFGALMTMLAQDVGFPVPEGGAQSLTDALVHRLQQRNGEVVLHSRVDTITVESGRATGVVTASGERHAALRAVLADTDAALLATRLLRDAPEAQRWRNRALRFQRDHATVKVDWALDRPVPWPDARCSQAATVHIGSDTASCSIQAAELAGGRVPGDPFVIVGQPTAADPSRAPVGAHTVWAYTHVPLRVQSSGVEGVTGSWDRDDTNRIADHLERIIESHAPGFGSRVLGRHVSGPLDFEAVNANLTDGGLGGGTANLHQQLVFRPMPGWGRSETPVRNLYLASASAHPGGGVHGGPGANAARAALAHAGDAAAIGAHARLRAALRQARITR